MRLVVGLGNPGESYAYTRHNVGWTVVEALARRLPPGRRVRACASEIVESRYAGAGVVLAWPQTYMNRSGEAVRALIRRYRTEPADVVVVYDDVELAAGRIKLRTRGSDAGHRGVRSVMEHLGTEHFARLRLGLGRPEPGVDLAEWVLEPFAAGEAATAERLVERGVETLLSVLRHGAERSMNWVNRTTEADAEQPDRTAEHDGETTD